MTETPGEGHKPQPPNTDPYQDPNQPSQEQPGYWEQQQPAPPPYGQQGYGYPQQGLPPVRYAPDHPKATTSLVLGILGVVVCGILGPFAWSIGKKTLDEIDASNGAVGGRGAAQAGYILGIVGTVLLAVAVLFVLAYIVIIAFFGIAMSGAAMSGA